MFVSSENWLESFQFWLTPSRAKATFSSPDRQELSKPARFISGVEGFVRAGKDERHLKRRR
jgi:hypothetical protein